MKSTHAESEIFRGKDTAKVFLLIYDEYTIGPLCGAQLRSVCNRDRVRYREGRERAKGGNGSLFRAGRRAVRLLVTLTSCSSGTFRGRTFAREFGFNLLANRLEGRCRSDCVSVNESQVYAF